MLAVLCAFVVVAISAAQSPATAAQQTSGGTPTLTGVLEGSRSVVFNTATDSCELIDIPDAPARAFRDYQGTVHLIAAHYIMRQDVGPALGA